MIHRRGAEVAENSFFVCRETTTNKNLSRLRPEAFWPIVVSRFGKISSLTELSVSAVNRSYCLACSASGTDTFNSASCLLLPAHFFPSPTQSLVLVARYYPEVLCASAVKKFLSALICVNLRLKALIPLLYALSALLFPSRRKSAANNS